MKEGKLDMPVMHHMGASHHPVPHLRQPGGHHHSNNHHQDQVSDPGYDPAKEPEVIRPDKTKK